MPSRNDIAPTLAIEPAFHFDQIFVIKVRKPNNGAEKQEEHGELGIHLSTSPNLHSTSNVSAGWTIGAGAEWMFAPHWSLKAEYLYVDLGNISSTINYAYATGNTSTLTATVRDTMNIVRGGINYHF